MTDDQIRAMSGLFQFNNAMDDGELSIDDLVEALNVSVAYGYETLCLSLCMAIIAVETAGDLPPGGMLGRMRAALREGR